MLPRHRVQLAERGAQLFFTTVSSNCQPVYLPCNLKLIRRGSPAEPRAP